MGAALAGPTSIERRIAYGTGDIPFIRTSDLANWELKIDPKQGVSEQIAAPIATKQRLKPNDILLVRDGTYLVGTTAMLTEDDTQIIYQSHLYRLRVLRADELSHFLLLAPEPVNPGETGRRKNYCVLGFCRLPTSGASAARSTARSREDVAILGGYGAQPAGWEAVSARFGLTSTGYAVGGGGRRSTHENIVTWVSDDVACNVTVERHESRLDGSSHLVPFSYRATHLFRREEEG